MNSIGLLLPGVGVTYNGEEIGMENTFITWEQCVDPQGINAGPDHYLEKTRDLERTPFQWDSSTSAGQHVDRRVFGHVFVRADWSNICAVYLCDDNVTYILGETESV
jgi:glycosidase